MKAAGQGQGPLKGQMPALQKAYRGRSNVAQAEERMKALAAGIRKVAATARDAHMAQGKSRQEADKLIQTTEAYINLQKKAKQAKEAYLNVLAEEMMAYQTNKAETRAMMKTGGVSGEAQEFVKGQYGRLAQAAAVDPKLGKEAFQDPAEQSYKMYSLARSMGDRGVGEDPEYRMERREMGAEEAQKPYEVVRLIETAIAKGLSSWGVKAAPKVKGRYQPRDIGELEYGGDTTEAAKKVSVLGEQLKMLYQSLEAGSSTIGDLQKDAGRVFEDMRKQYKSMEGKEGGPGEGTSYRMVEKKLVEWRAALMERMINDAKGIERAIAAAEGAGMATKDPGGMETLLKQYAEKVEEIRKFGQRTTRMVGPGAGHAVSPVMTPQGIPIEEGIQAGMAPGIEGLKDRIKEIAGRGEEGAEFMQRYEKTIMRVVEGMLKGEKATSAWQAIMEKLAEEPQNMHTNLVKMTQIMGKASSETAAWEAGKFSEAALGMKQTAKWANELATNLAGVPIENWGDIIMQARTMGSAKQQVAVEKGRGTGAQSVAAQYEEANQMMVKYQKRLEKIIKTEGYRKAGKPAAFEPIDYKIRDPDSGKVLQTLRIEAKRTGKVIKTSMKQAGAAAGNTGNQIRSALRRVVQWGFASGIVYGLIRAFRAVTRTVTEVQTKIAALQKVMDTTITDFKAMQNAAADMAAGYGIAIEEVLDGMVVYAQQGLKVNEINERTKATLLAVNVTTLSATEATEALTAAHKVFGDAVDNSLGYVDAWSAVAAKHAITAKDLALAVQKSGAAAKTAGIGFNDFLGVVTAIGVVTRQTGKEIGTSIKFMSRAMRRPTATKQLISLGVSGQDVAGNMKPAMDILGAVADKWKGLSRAQQLSTAQAMAGIRHYNSFIVLMNNWKEALAASEDAAESQGFATRKNALAVATFAKQMAMLREEMKKLALDIGGTILPIVQAIVTGMKKAVDIFGKLPNVLKTTLVVGAGGLVAFAKGADVVLDTLMAFKGEGMGRAAKEAGLLALAGSGVKKAWGGLKNLPKAFAGMGTVLGSYSKQMKGMRSAADMSIVVANFGGVTKAVLAARGALTGFIVTLQASKVAMAGTIVGLAVLAAAAVVSAIAYSRMQKSGKEVEDQHYDTIGAMEDQIDSLRKQGKAVKSTQHLWEDYRSTLEAAADPVKLQENIEAGTFKSPEKALKEYRDGLYETGVAIASLDPSNIEGISETGEYLYLASAAFSELSASAMDAKKATIAAMQVKTIKAYGDEITKAQGFWDNFTEVMSGDTKDMSLLGDLKRARKKVNDLAKEQKNLSDRGIASFGIQKQMNSAVEEELRLRGEMLASAGEMMRLLKGMPTFENQELARTMLTSEKMVENLEGMAASGVAGREATLGSLQMQQMGRNVGLGGLVGAEATVNPQRLMEELIEKNLALRPGGEILTDEGKRAPMKEGELGILTKESARTLLELAQGAERLAAVDDPEQLGKIIENARTVITGMDPLSNELIYYFTDGIEGGLNAIRESDMGPEMQEIMANMLRLDRGLIDAEAEKTRKLLTIQSAGAMAGIRVPEGGMPDIGPGMARELSTEQRVMGMLPDELQRMATVQKELTAIVSRYNEELGEGAQISENAASAIIQNHRVLDAATKQLAASLQMENFDLSRLAHMATALAKLEQSLEAAATASRDAAIEEDIRAKYLTHTAGALAGLTVAPALDIGKGMRELGAQEKLQVEIPGLGRTFHAISGMAKQRDTDVQGLIDLTKQMADFDQMLGDLEDSGQKLSEQQKLAFRAEGKDVDKGALYVADQIQKSADQQLKELQYQTPLLDRMLTALGVLADVEVAGEGLSGKERVDAKKAALEKGMTGIKGQELSQLLGAGGSKLIESFLSQMVGLKERKEPKKSLIHGADYFERQRPKMDFETEEGEKQFEDISKRIHKLYNQIEQATRFPLLV